MRSSQTGSGEKFAPKEEKTRLRCFRVIARREEMAEETAGDEEGNSGNSSERGVKKPELCRGHFFEKAADPADEIVAGKKRQIINADNSSGQCSGSDPRVKRE